jgi:tetratricopeptide (TPR) repeat protein
VISSPPLPSGVTVMRTSHLRWLPALAAVLAAIGLVVPAPAADDEAALKTKALELNKLTGNDAIEGQIKVLVKDKGTSQLLAVVVKMTKDKNRPLNYNAAFVMARSAQELKESDACEKLYRYCSEEALKLQSGQKMAQSFGGLIDLYYEHKQFDKTVKLCKEFLDIQGNETVNRLKPAVMERMIQSLARQQKYDEALKLVNNLVEAEEEDKGWWALQLKGWVLREAEKPDEAAKTIETVLERLKDDKTLKKEQKSRYVERNRYFLSSVYIDLKEVDKAADQLKALLELKPNDPTYNNDLGYIWADHDKNLDEAEKLIRKALEEDKKQRKMDPDFKPEDDKDNAAYLDSLGWVLYKQKKYKEAKAELEKAVKDKEGQHIEIFDHLGDACKALGDKAAALSAWKKGVESVDKREADAPPATKREKDRKTVVEKKIKELDEK